MLRDTRTFQNNFFLTFLLLNEPLPLLAISNCQEKRKKNRL